MEIGETGDGKTGVGDPGDVDDDILTVDGGGKFRVAGPLIEDDSSDGWNISRGATARCTVL